jgi:hypothetical protein
MARKSRPAKAPPVHRGRLQAQGPDTEKSVAWARETPPTKSEMLAMLDRLWAKLTESEREEREECLEKVRQYIQEAPATGINAPVPSKSFRNRKLRGGQDRSGDPKRHGVCG